MFHTDTSANTDGVIQKNQYIRDLQGVAAASGIQITFPFLSILSRYIWMPVISGATEINRRLTQYAEQSLKRHYRIIEEEGEESKPTLFSKLYNKAGGDELSFEELRDNAQAYIIAGSDTIVNILPFSASVSNRMVTKLSQANTLTYLIWEVCKRPEIKEELLRELQSLPDNYGYADVKHLPYLNQVIEETLRLYPAAPSLLPRVVPLEGVQLAGHYIPAGCTVGAQAWSMHRDPSTFPEPLNYDPSRWQTPTKAMKDAFVPFGGGSRGRSKLAAASVLSLD